MASKSFVHLFKSLKVQPNDPELWQVEIERFRQLLYYEDSIENENENPIAHLDAQIGGIEIPQNNNHELFHAADHSGMTPLIGCIICNKKDAFEFLISVNVDINQADIKGNSPLIVASFMGRTDFVDLLLQNGADFGLTNQYGYSALMAAAGGGHLEIVRLLFRSGAVLNLRSQHGMTALMFACMKQNSDVVSFLAKQAKLDIADDDGNTAISISATLGDLLSLKALVKENENVDRFNKRGKTPLMYAAEEGHIECVKYLVDVKADIDICMEDGKTAIDFAVERERREIVEILGGTPLNNKEDLNCLKPIIYASLLGDLERVKQEVMNNENVNVTDEFGRTALMAASQEGFSEIVSFLLEKKANINQTNQSGMTALSYAVQRRMKNVQLQLVYYGADTEIADIYTRTLFMNCVASGNLEIVKDVDKLGCNIFYSDSAGMNALMIAAKGGHMKIVQYLISQGCKKGHQCGQTLTAANYAFINDHTQVHDWLEACDIEGENEKGQGEKLMEFSSTGDVTEVEKLLKSGCNPDFKNSEDETPITVASAKGHVSVVKCLIQHNATVNWRKPSNGRTALLVASAKGYGLLVEALLEAGAYPNTSDKQGLSPLMIASAEMYVDIGISLLNHDARALTADRNGVTALLLASNSGCVEMGKLLLQYGAHIDASDKEGDTPLYRAARNGHMEMVKFLVEHGADLSLVNHKGNSALDGAMRGSNSDIAKYLYDCGATSIRIKKHLRENASPEKSNRIFNLEDIERAVAYRAEIEHISGSDTVHVSKEQSLFDICDEDPFDEEAANQSLQQPGTDINMQNGNGDTILLIAIRTNRHRTCEWLIEKGANVNCQDSNGISPLIYASQSNDVRLVKKLISIGQADVNQKDFKGVSPLMISSSRPSGVHSVNMVDLLLKAGAHINDVDSNGDTPLIFSIRSRNLDVVKQLLSNGASVNVLNNVCDNAVSLAAASNYLDIFHCVLEYYHHIRQDIIISVLQYLMFNNQYDALVLLLEAAGDESGYIQSDLEDFLLQALCSQNNTDLFYCMSNLGLFHNHNLTQRYLERLLEKVNCQTEKANDATTLLLQCLETSTIGKQCVFTESCHHGWYEQGNRVIDLYTTEEGGRHRCIVIGDELQINDGDLCEDPSGESTTNKFDKVTDENNKFSEITKQIALMKENLENINSKNEQFEKEYADIQESNRILIDEIKCLETKIKNTDEKLERLNEQNEMLLRISGVTEVEVILPELVREKWKLVCQCGTDSCSVCSSEIVARYECTRSKQSGTPYTSLPEDKRIIEPTTDREEKPKLVLLPKNDAQHVSVMSYEHKPCPKMYLFKFQASISQSSIDGRQMPSNACALIALFFAYQYIKKPSIMQAIPPINKINKEVFDQVVEAIRYGNVTHEHNFQGQPWDLSPEDVNLLTNHLGVRLVKKIDVDTRDPTTMVNHVMNLKSNQVILFIKHCKVVSIFPCNRDKFLLLFDSHPHIEPTSHYGAYLFFAKKEESTIRDLFISYDELCDSRPFYGQFAIYEV